MTRTSRQRVARRPALAVLLLAAAACSSANGAGERGETVRLLDYRTRVPAGWVAHPPQSTMRLAEFRVSAPDATTEGAEVVVFFFGAGQGGTVEANIARWSAQFADSVRPAPEPAVERLADTMFPTTIVQLEGTYRRGIGMETDAEAKPDQVLIAAVVETPSGNLHIQLYGPSAVVLRERDALLSFVRGIEPAE
jgi:hypothetical protein